MKPSPKTMTEEQEEIITNLVDTAYKRGLTEAPMFNLRGRLPKPPTNPKPFRIVLLILFSPVLVPLCVGVVGVYVLAQLIISACLLAWWAVTGELFNEWYNQNLLTKWCLQRFAGFDEDGNSPNSHWYKGPIS